MKRAAEYNSSIRPQVSGHRILESAFHLAFAGLAALSRGCERFEIETAVGTAVFLGNRQVRHNDRTVVAVSQNFILRGVGTLEAVARIQ